PITQYSVTVSPGGTTLTTASSPLSFTGLTNGTAYTFTVVAENSVGPGSAGGPSLPVTPGPLPDSCKAALLQDPNTPSGVLTLALPGGSAPIYCDMTTDGGGWNLVYKLSKGVSAAAATLWEGATPQNEMDTSLLDLQPSASPYLSRLVTSYWNTGGVTWS